MFAGPVTEFAVPNLGAGYSGAERAVTHVAADVRGAVHNAAVSLHSASRSTEAERSNGLITTSVAPASK
jgi:hypothetical protein